MPIYPLTYRHWEGDRLGWWSRFRAFARTGVSTVWRSKLRRAVVFVAMAPVAIYFGFVWFISSYLFSEEETIANVMLNALGSDVSTLLREHSEPRAAFWTHTVYWFLTAPQSWFAMLVIVVCGAGLISADRRHNAHEIYFARPVGWGDYIVGKLAVIGWFLGLILLVPGILLILQILAFSLKATDILFLLDLFPRLALVWLMWTVCAGLPMLAISSLGPRTGLAAFLWTVLWIGSDTVANIAHQIYCRFKWPPTPPKEVEPGQWRHMRPPDEWALPNWTEAFSFKDNLISLQHWIMGADSANTHFGDLPVFGRQVLETTPGVSPLFSACVMGGVVVVSLLILRVRVRPQGAA